MGGSVRHARCIALFAALAAALLLQALQASRAAAREPAATGWWSALGQQVATATAPDVPGGGLLVQGGASESAPSAFAALSYGLSDARPTRLVLAVTGNTTPGSVLQACLLTESFTPAYGEAMSDAPRFDCAGAVRATVSDDGAAQSFQVAGLVRNGTLAIAILPTASTDRVVLAKPSADSLSVAPALPIPSASSPAGTGPTVAGPPQTGSAAPTSSSSGAGLASSLALPPAVGAPAGAAPITPEIAVGTAPEQASPVQAEVMAAGLPAPGEVGGHRAAGLLAALAAFAAIALWLAAGRSAGRPTTTTTTTTTTPPPPTAEVDA